MKEKLQGLITGVVAGAIMTGTIGVLAAQYTATDNPFPIKINGAEVKMEGYNINGNTYFKLRDIGEHIGFDVDFKDGTIYIGENSDINQVSDEIKYYSEKPWCPDFGACMGAKLIDSKKVDDKMYYSYNILFDGDISDYFDLIIKHTNLKLNPASLADFIMFENLDTGHTVVCILSKSDYTIKIIVE